MLNTSTATAGPATPPPDIAAVERAMAALGPEPIGEWMRGQGFPPENCLLILPLAYRQLVGALPPNYVKFSPLVDRPFLTQDPFNLSNVQGPVL